MECIHKFLEEPGYLVNHHLDSFNQFVKQIPEIIKNQNPLTNLKNKNDKNEFRYKCRLWVGTKTSSELVFGVPVFTENGVQKPLYPNDARLRNLTYYFSIHAKITFEIEIDGVVQEHTPEEMVFLGNFPIMLQSEICILHNVPPDVRFAMGECRSDPGGYFIIDGSEKVIICQEGRARNTICTTKKYSDKYYYSADIKSYSDDGVTFPRVAAVRIATKEDASSSVRTKDGVTLHEMVVELPDVRLPIPLFVVMRALGVLTDKKIIETCLLGENNLREYFHESVCDAMGIYTQHHALEFIGSFTKYKSLQYAVHILVKLFLSHMGDQLIDKAFFLGHMVKKVLRMALGVDPVTDRDSFRMKRVEPSGVLLHDLFHDFYHKQLEHIDVEIDRAHNKNKNFFNEPANFPTLFLANYHQFFEERITENGLITGFKGRWGATEYTQLVGVSQKLNRLTFNSAISHLRKCVLQLDDSAKVIAPRLLHSSQWGLFDPVDCDGEIGTHKQLSLCSRITDGFPKKRVLDVMTEYELHILPLHTLTVESATLVKLFLNGQWVGCIEEPEITLHTLVECRRRGILPSTTSISWNIGENTLYIYTDAGRLQRPLFYVDHKRKLSYSPDRLDSWVAMTSGDTKKPCMIEYLDADESNSSLIGFDPLDDFEKTLHTHVEIHGSSLLGFMGNQIIFAEHNQLPRNAYACSQSRQGVSVYHTNYQNRMDTMGVVLNYGQTPLIQSNFLQPFKSLPYGANAIVAIMCYTGYNTEDAILFNRSSLERGMFNTSYFKTYEVSESNGDIPLVFQGSTNTDENGIVQMNTEVRPDTVLMRMAQGDNIKNIYPNRDQEGRVDRTFISEDIPGNRVAKVRICHERMPGIGDKFSSRAGQKGTCGLILNETDMPFTSDGIRPDLIINPHALPSRMTIGQLIESLIGKVHLHNGGLGDCTAFNTTNIDETTRDTLFVDTYRRELPQLGYHSSGTEVLYNGFTGEQIESNIFIGPTYYLRLKHMVADKINFRVRGPNTALTRQPVQGRSNEGGLRIGEMERDGVIANGMASFVRESLMDRGDGTMMVNNSRVPYKIYVDNTSGLLAIYDDYTNLQISPSIDGVVFENDTLLTVPKHKKTFSALNVPYAFKLLLQELATMNVQARLITSDTVDQFENMRYKALQTLTTVLFSSLKLTQYALLENTLYVASGNTPCRDILINAHGLNPMIFPYVTRQFERISIARTIQPKPYTSEYQKERCELDIYKPHPDNFDTTLSYFVDKMKTAIFVRIKNNKLFNFLPLYNVNFTNDFYTLIDDAQLEALLKSLPSNKRKETSKDPKTWHATNCLLRTEKEDRDPTDNYLSEMYDMLVDTCSHRKVNDCLFFLSRKDFPHLRKDWKESFEAIYGDVSMTAYDKKTFIPVVGQSTSIDHADFTFPTGDDWNIICPEKKFAKLENDRGHKGIVCKNTSPSIENLPAWETRENKCIWRGQGTGCGNDSNTNPRMYINELVDEFMDTKIVNFTNRIKGKNVDKSLRLEYINPKDRKNTGTRMEMSEQVKYKYTLNVEGNSAAYRFGGLLGLGFCVLNVKSRYTLWFEPMLKMKTIDDPDIGNADCILVNTVSEVTETMKWCLDHDEICQQIAKNGMNFYEKYFTKEFVYDYVADLCNSISGMLQPQKNMYDIDNGKLIESLKPKHELTFKSYKETNAIPTSTTVIIVPFRDSGDQDRGEQLAQFIEHYKNINILVVEQSEQDKFNRGMLLNIGVDYLTRELPNVNTFVVHDVDILLPEDIVDRYYGEDGKDLVHLGRLIKDDKYTAGKKDYFLGRVLRISKSKFKQMNGFPNTFYGWGGEDDALIHRIGSTEVYRPDEPKTGIEMKTRNDILPNKIKDRMEGNKIEQLILDDIQWKIDGVNSLQYVIENNLAINSHARKITVQLNPAPNSKPPSVSIVSEPVESVEPVQDEPEMVDIPEPETDDLEIVDKGDTLTEEETKNIHKIEI